MKILKFPLHGANMKRGDSGANLVEYIFLVSLILIITIPGMTAFSDRFDCTINTTKNSLAVAATPTLPIIPPSCSRH